MPFWFEDFVVGARTELGRHTFTAAAIKEFAAQWDPQAFHLDEEAAAATHFGRLAASGWHTAAVAVRLGVEARQAEEAEARSRGEDIPAGGPSPGIRDMKWLRPVFAGDTITYAAEVVELRPIEKKPGWGIRFQRTTGTNQDGQLVYSVTSGKLVPRRAKDDSVVGA